VWDMAPAIDFLNYPAGTWGPEAAAALVVPDGGTWLTPVLSQEMHEAKEAEGS
jgi:glucose-6-phosphate 1-dehydrogenase